MIRICAILAGGKGILKIATDKRQFTSGLPFAFFASQDEYATSRHYNLKVVSAAMPRVKTKHPMSYHRMFLFRLQDTPLTIHPESPVIPRK